MKTKLHWVAVLASAAMITQANAGDHHGGGGGSFAAPASSTHGSARSFARGGGQSYGRAPMYGQRFSPGGARWMSPMGGPQRHFTASGMGRFAPGPVYGRNGLARNRNVAAYGLTNKRHDIGTRQAGPGKNLPGNWRNHVTARHSADWQSKWDRNRDHVWHGHHCRFINGSWVIFDFGFYPWWGYGYGYPYDYYYPYGYYNQGYYDPYGYGDDQYYDQNDYSSDQSTGSTIAAAQEQLAQEGYYRGEIDGVIGPATRRAVARYQSHHGLQVSGALTAETLAALGLRQLASY
jgi:hypothetical protein